MSKITDLLKPKRAVCAPGNSSGARAAQRERLAVRCWLCLKPIECPRCREKPEQDVFQGNVFITCCCDDENPAPVITSIIAPVAYFKWNAHCRRELRRMKKEGEKK